MHFKILQFIGSDNAKHRTQHTGSARATPRQGPAGRRLLKRRLLINFPKRNKQSTVQSLNARLSQPCRRRQRWSLAKVCLRWRCRDLPSTLVRTLTLFVSAYLQVWAGMNGRRRTRILKRVRGDPLDTLLDTAGLVAFCPSSAAFSQLIENPSPLRCRFLTKYSFCIFSKTREPVQFLENPPPLSSISIRHGA